MPSFDFHRTDVKEKRQNPESFQLVYQSNLKTCSRWLIDGIKSIKGCETYYSLFNEFGSFFFIPFLEYFHC